MKIKKGDVVQLNSGGAPLTVTAFAYHGMLQKDSYCLSCVSRGGLVQELWVPEAAFRFYHGPVTPSLPQERK